METIKLYKIADREGITVDFPHMPNVKSVCISLNGKNFIAIDKEVRYGSAEEKVKLAHEIGHCASNGFYSVGEETKKREDKEKRAESWAIENLVPLSELEQAVKNGHEDLLALTEYFGVTVDFMQKALRYYSEKN